MISSLRVTATAAVVASLALALPAQAAHTGTGAYHIFFMPSYQQRTGRVPDLGATGKVEYFGGTVFSKVEAVSVIWGSKVNSTTVAEIPDFTGAIVNSTFIDQLGEYSTRHHKSVDGHKGSRQTIARGTFYGQVQIAPKNASLTLTDRDIQKELSYQIKIGVLPPQGANVLYMVYFPADVTIDLKGQLSCQAFGAYHSASSRKETPSNIFYAVEPDCNSGFGFITFAASHEFAEATTDNIPTPGSHPRFPQAWNTSDGYEIGDLCSSSGNLTDGTRSYEVTQVYLDSTGACSTGNYTSP